MVKKWRWEFCNYSKTKYCIEKLLMCYCSLKAHEPLCAPLLLNFAQKHHFEWLKFNCVNLSLQTGELFCNPTDWLISSFKYYLTHFNFYQIQYGSTEQSKYAKKPYY